jgi:hypothetical protein
MKRVFFIECAGLIWRSIAQQCIESANWQPVLWTATDADREPVSKLCPDVVFLTGPDAALGVCRPTWPIPALDARLLADLAPSESIALHMMDRMDPGCGSGFSHDARRRHYHHLLRYWIGALDALQPDLIVFSISPHIVFDYILMSVARYRGVRTVMFERIGLPGWVFPLRDFDHGSPQLRSALSSRPSVPMEGVLEPFRTWLLASIDGQSAIPPNFQKKLQRYKLEDYNKIPSLVHGLMHEFKRAAALLLRNGLRPAANSYLRSGRYPHGRCGPMETFTSRLKGVLAKRRLMRFHEALAKADGTENYVLLALHYQPERATVPMGAQFGDQLLIVDLLSKALPARWKLYVKEHPWQLQSYSRGEVQRTKAFYADIATHPNVLLLPLSASTAALVRGAQAVVTLTGSVGWDALCAGVPVLLFGAAWYRDCPGVHQIKSHADLCEALVEIGAGHKPERQTLAAFCAALSGVCVPGVLEPELERAEHLSHPHVASAMATALIDLDSLEEEVQ